MSAELLGVFYRYNHHVLKVNTGGLGHEDSLRQPSPGGNCLNWILGHIVANRNVVLKALGQHPVRSAYTGKPYERGSVPLTEVSRAVRLEKIMEDLDASQGMIMEALDGVDEERLSGPAPPEAAPSEADTLGAFLAGLAFHEAYHAGQTGLIRRLLGKDGAIP